MNLFKNSYVDSSEPPPSNTQLFQVYTTPISTTALCPSDFYWLSHLQLLFLDAALVNKLGRLAFEWFIAYYYNYNCNAYIHTCYTPINEPIQYPPT